jgi:hypothetical protein
MSDQEFVDHLNSVPFEIDEFCDLLEESAKLPRDGREPGDGAFVVILYYNEKAEAGLLRPEYVHEKAMAAYFRMSALARMIDEGQVSGWIAHPGGNELHWVRQPAFEVAAIEPLILLENGDPGFDPTSFHCHVFERMNAEGEA